MVLFFFAENYKDIDADSIASYIESSKTASRFFSKMNNWGFQISSDRFSDGDLAILVGLTRKRKLNSLADLENILESELENDSFYEAVIESLDGKNAKQKRMSKPASLRLAILAASPPKTAKKIVKSLQFKQYLQKALLNYLEESGGE